MHEHHHHGLEETLLHAGLHALGITLFVFLMMVVVDYLNVWTQGRFSIALKNQRARQYLLAGVLGALPGCLGSFLAVTLYIRGIIGFGAIVGCFLASSGDAAFVMLATIPQPALLLFGILLVLGVLFGFVVDVLAKRLGITPAAECQHELHHLAEPDCRTWPERGIGAHLKRPHPLRLVLLVVMAAAAAATILGVVGPEEWNWIRIAILVLLAAGSFVILTVPDHYLIEHIGHHITRHHLPRIFAWTLGTLVTLAVLEHFLDLSEVVSGHMIWVLVLAALVGLIPDSGPHLLFVFLFAQGTVPFSVLLTSSMVQDGHGLLPLLSVSIKDSMLIKLFNLVLGLLVGLGVYLAGA